jgi:hypothetical protein
MVHDELQSKNMTCSSAYHKISLYNVASRSHALMLIDLSSITYVCTTPRLYNNKNSCEK